MKIDRRYVITLVILFAWTLAAVGLHASNAANHASPPGVAVSSLGPTARSDAPSPDFTNGGDSSSYPQPGNESEASPPEPVPASVPVPASAPAKSSYTVKSGDTLWDIARIYHTTVDQLQALNNLDSDALSLGQTLIVTGEADKSVKIAERSSPAASAPAPSRSGQTSRAAKALQYAAQYLNTPYKYGGATPAGFDCSGFTQYVYKHVGVSLPRTAAAQAGAGTRVAKANLQPGDLVFFATDGGGIDHVGIYTGNGRFIHSSSPRSGGVIYTSLNDNYYAKSYTGATRIE